MIPPTVPVAPLEPTGVLSVGGDDWHLPEHLEPWLGGDRQMTRRVAKRRRSNAKSAQIERKIDVRCQFVVSCPVWRWLHERTYVSSALACCVHAYRVET
jgi:hypothetical protein